MRSAPVVLAALLMAGCLAEPPTPDVARAVADTRPMDWSPGNWWSYRATVGNVSFDVALIVHEQHERGSRVGTNISSGFFGLPFHGNVSGELNPEVAGSEWPLYRFPLHDGKSWSYELFGYDAETTARAAMVDVPGVGLVPGFRLEATSYGQVFARYDYAPATGWFTTLELIQPTKQETLLRADLTGFGTEYGRAYYVERVLREVRIQYPAAPGSLPIDIPTGKGKVQTTLHVETTAGVILAELKDASGGSVLTVQGVGKGAASDRVTSSGRTARHWTLEHKGGGQGEVVLVVTGLVPVGGEPPRAATPPSAAPALTDAYSARPRNEQWGHATSLVGV